MEVSRVSFHLCLERRWKMSEGRASGLGSIYVFPSTNWSPLAYCTRLLELVDLEPMVWPSPLWLLPLIQMFSIRWPTSSSTEQVESCFGPMLLLQWHVVISYSFFSLIGGLYSLSGSRALWSGHQRATRADWHHYLQWEFYPLHIYFLYFTA
jgi:hypothetical protein